MQLRTSLSGGCRPCIALCIHNGVHAYVRTGMEVNFVFLLRYYESTFRIICSLCFKSVCMTFQAEKSNKRHRPIGIGVQGLADMFLALRYPFENEEAQQLNRDIFETIYYSALKSSCELAQVHGPYETYEGSPVSRGVRSTVAFLFSHLLTHYFIYFFASTTQ